MAEDFLLPDIGEGLTEAEIVRWLIPVGGRVGLDEPLVEIETDKALMEIPSPFAGTVVSHGAAAGTILQVGSVLATIETGEGAPTGEASGAGRSAGEGDSADAAPIVGSISSEAAELPARAGLSAAGPDPVPGTRRVEALPIVRKLAADLGVDLTEVSGSGPGGRITRADVLASADGRPGDSDPATRPDRAGAASDRSPGDGVVTRISPRADPESHGATVVPMSHVRRTVAERVRRSWSEIPHVTTFADVDVTRLMAARRAVSRRRGSPVSIDAMLVKAVRAALAEHPDITASLVGDDHLAYPESVDIGVAVDTDDGLMIVVVEDPEHLDLVEVTAEIARLAAGARSRTLGVGEFGGQAFTVSNIGAVGGGYGTPIVPFGTTGILSVGRAEDRVVARDGSVAIAPLMPLSLSYDHRVVDGAAGRRFLATVIENLAEPALFLG